MKTMTISFLLAAALAGVLFLVVWYLTNNAEAAKAASAFAVTALPSISTWLEQAQARQSAVPGKKMTIRSFEGFSISLPLSVAIGTVVGVAIVNIAALFSGFVVGGVASLSGANTLDNAKAGELLRVGSVSAIPVLMIGFYLLAKWLTWRSKKGILAVLLTVLMTAITDKLMDFWLVPENWQSFYEMERTARTLFLMTSAHFATLLIPSLVGFWRGRKEKTSRYMGYLLATLPQETQNSLVDLAYGEVTKIVDARRKAAPPAGVAAAVPT
jgi:hypothetical protein